MDKSFIVNALRKNGVQEGMCLEVHSSLKSYEAMGWHENSEAMVKNL